MPKWLWIALLGVALLLPGALYWVWSWIGDPVRAVDTRSAFQRLAEVRLSEAVGGRGVEITATIPSDASWRRVIRNWGDPRYFIGSVLPRPRTYMYCLQDLGARVEARIGDQPVDLETAYVPYGYSSDCQPAGLSFRAPPGSVVKIHVTVARLPSQAADLVVEPYWTGGTKDRLVGTALEEDLREITTALGVAGIVTILIAAFLYSHPTLPPAG
jgi:hypothetical protein